MAFKDSPEINLILNSLKNDDFDCDEIENPYTLLSESIQNLKEYEKTVINIFTNSCYIRRMSMPYLDQLKRMELISEIRKIIEKNI